MSTTINVFGMEVDQTYFWCGVFLAIIVVCCLTGRCAVGRGFPSFQQIEGMAPFIPAMPWIEYPSYPAPFRGDKLYLGGSTKCFSCEKHIREQGLPEYLARPTKCVDCEK